jgi:sugar transferase (PEP-CTERM/EpsH1 system associated)
MPDPLHVAHAVLSLDFGGLERIVADLVRQGRRRGQRVSVICLERPGTLAERVAADGANLVCLDKKPGVQLATIGRLKKLLAELRPDVLHTHQVGALFYAGPAARRAGVPVVLHTEHINNLRKARGGRLSRMKMAWLWWLAARYADRYCCVSEDIVDDMVRRRIVPRKKLRFVANGIDTALFQNGDGAAAIREQLGIPAEAPVVGTVGRLNEVKSQDLLIRAFARVRTRFPAAHLVLVGDGPMRATLESLAADLGVAGAVHFAGYQDRPERYLHVMDLFALTSRMEGMPLAILEAWAAGRPVIASAVGGVPDLVRDGVSGVLFPSGDETALVGALESLIAAPDRARSLADAGRKEVETRYDLGRMAREYEQHYQELLAAAKGGVVCASSP